MEKEKTISIDESKKNQEEVQKSTDNSIIEIENLAKLKENEILKFNFEKFLISYCLYYGRE